MSGEFSAIEWTTEDDAIVERKEHYLIREQIWSAAMVPVRFFALQDRSAELDLGNYFYVNLRHLMPGGEGELVLSNFSETLLKFLRQIEDIGSHLRAEATESISRISARLQHLSDVRKQGTSLVDQFLSESREHLSVLTNYLLELYKPKAAKLALQLADGCIEFDLLIFISNWGSGIAWTRIISIWCLDTSFFRFQIQFTCYSKASGFCLERRIYNKANMTVHLTGNAYSWDGKSYLETPVSCAISFYHVGTRDLDSLPCQPLTPEIEAELIARGRLYTALSGIHYRSYHNDRIIVDGIGHADPHSYPSPLRSRLQSHQKTWSTFYVTEIEPVSFDDDAWDHLVMDPETKVLIKSLVQVTRNSNSFASKTISDVITGKGGGLICVLHGPPGTGKTLTAEAVAEHLKRPLYIVGTSELSTKALELEAKLRSILNLATAWDAVLLIDEADVCCARFAGITTDGAFFGRFARTAEPARDRAQFLGIGCVAGPRIPPGVLFLTTNRVKVFDAAFLSRFSIGIDQIPGARFALPPSHLAQVLELAGVKTKDADGSGRSTPTDMVLLEDPAKVATMSEAELDELAEKPFNGRTIKNLVRTAQALALASDEPMSKAHVDIVVRSQEKFLREFANVSGVE
ncbi:P-loop containing nucleoside triphosphate hydrolase protein [Mycena leptocephala]|nr:P-loop containing nucleoside triphosphate hydrolase protein [Mycena leptocephala]